jgi:hypothetical protein
MIIIDRTRYLKNIVTGQETSNEHSSADFPVIGNCPCDSNFGNFSPLIGCPSYSKLRNNFSTNFSNDDEGNPLLSGTGVRNHETYRRKGGK